MSDQCIGEIRMFAGNYAPEGWALCNGQTVPISGNEALYSILGRLWGGDGKTNFGLPDLRSRLPISQGTAAASKTAYAVGQKGGTETVTLTASQMPTHSHTPTAANVKATSGSPADNLMAQTVNSKGGTNEDAMYVKTDDPLARKFDLNAAAVSSAGGSQPHTNIMPCNPVNFIIALQGIYPEFQQ